MNTIFSGMNDIGILVYILLLILVAYFGLANATIHLINHFRFYRPFGRRMAEGRIYKDPAYAQMMGGRGAASVFVFLLCAGGVAYGCWHTGLPGVIAAAAAYLAGILLYRRKLRWELWNVQRFVRQYANYLDKAKFARFLTQEYGISLDELADDAVVMKPLPKKKP